MIGNDRERSDALFEQYRPLMFSIAYRMLSSVTEAEDIVQEAYLRYQMTTQEEIVSPKAFFSTVVTRLCLNHLQLARNQRETYLGPWLPEPVLTETDERFAPAQQVELQESISLAFLVLLEQLTPLERAVFLLRQVFDYEYEEIAAVLGNTEAACRQLFSRARKHVAAHRPRFTPTPEEHQAILQRFIQATGDGDVEAFTELLAEDVVLWTDGGGKARGAALHPIHGREAVGRFMLARRPLAGERWDAAVSEVNGEPAVILRSGGEVRLVIAVVVEQEKVSTIRIMGNPDKLKGVKRPNQRAEG